MGDIIILTDGVTFFEKHAVSELLKPFENKNIGGSSVDLSRKIIVMMHLELGAFFFQSADHRRSKTMCKVDGKDYFVSK
jgi:hypothetical protein